MTRHVASNSIRHGQSPLATPLIDRYNPLSLLLPLSFESRSATTGSDVIRASGLLQPIKAIKGYAHRLSRWPLHFHIGVVPLELS